MLTGKSKHGSKIHFSLGNGKSICGINNIQITENSKNDVNCQNCLKLYKPPKHGGKRKGAGRKPISKKDFKGKVVALRLNESELNQIKNHIKKIGYKNVSTYLRDIVNRDLTIWGNK